MGNHIGEYDKVKMVIAILEVLEISGENPRIEKIQSECYKELNDFLQGVDREWLIYLLKEVRKDAVDKVEH
jgi:hypothetical protein